MEEKEMGVDIVFHYLCVCEVLKNKENLILDKR